MFIYTNWMERTGQTRDRLIYASRPVGSGGVTLHSTVHSRTHTRSHAPRTAEKRNAKSRTEKPRAKRSPLAPPRPTRPRHAARTPRPHATGHAMPSVPGPRPAGPQTQSSLLASHFSPLLSKSSAQGPRRDATRATESTVCMAMKAARPIHMVAVSYTHLTLPTTPYV